jgi:hypothetical protein
MKTYHTTAGPMPSLSCVGCAGNWNTVSDDHVCLLSTTGGAWQSRLQAVHPCAAAGQSSWVVRRWWERSGVGVILVNLLVYSFL